MTNMELAYRLAEIIKAYAETPEGHVCVYAWGLQRKLFHDLVNDGVSDRVARRIALGW